MKIFTSKSKYSIGLTKEPYEPIDLTKIYERVKKKKLEEQQQQNQ